MQTEVIYNPATLEKIVDVSYGGTKDTEDAIQAAHQAFPQWSSMTARERSGLLYKANQLMLEQAEELAITLTSEQGKPLQESRGEIKSAASFLLWYAEEANRLYGETIPSSMPSKRLMVIPQAIGVVGAITPWNFPASMITRKLAPALAAGCTVILKPAPETPLTAIKIVKILEEAGLPRGVVNLVTGDAKAIGSSLLNSEIVRLITFTGSTEVGKYLIKESSHTVKKLSLELGGHAPILVFDDAQIDQAVDLTLASKFRNAGQTCICANRVYVQRSIFQQFTDKLIAKVKEMKLGDGLEDGTDIGPLINLSAKEKVQRHLDDAVAKGAKVIKIDNKETSGLKGHFYSPTILTNVTDDMRVMYEETFGPIIPIQPFDEEDEAITKANDTNYGLAAYMFTKNLDRSVRVMEKLQYGIVGINDVFPALAEAPFGGIKQSGIGKEGGHHGINEFVEMKYVSMGIER
ncbi:NAD-dependent succinate-semialdehyde dehydrogenase [Aquibacillus sp. 3ASR75-11]|uniref:NAD-dependent succinate-semialdehyde dehydrogenase n=2 Tax=Terrihalobacillus insolitus TaxID=2950438 RepID=A0A9X3WQ64_9BACI|nr:NAD-dependent succinate-semialdehyde dehydrogenase [Terrihalobacillus insolitus]MDC3423180.1 NAD-dependent succinate-semialdehyde dehydrogenase [Terrihalobacillus insolitus]